MCDVLSHPALELHQARDGEFGDVADLAVARI